MTTPRYHTPRDERRATYGPKIARVAAALGTPLMPWQARAADVLGEVDARGRFAYPTVVITVPRQAGKTALTMAVCLHRTLMIPGAKVWYTAQNGMVARERAVEMFDTIDRTSLGAVVKTKRGAGDTRLVVPATGSQFRPHPPTVDSLHGEQGDLNTVDEGWAYGEAQAHALMQAIVPIQNTRPRRQTIILSTEGDASSTWLHGVIDAARAGEPGTAIIDYGIGPDVDPEDVQAVAAAHPAIGRTVEVDVLTGALTTLGPAGFARAFGNRRTATRDHMFTADQLAAVTTRDPIPETSRVAFGVATAYDRSETAVVAVGLADDGVPVAEVVEPDGLRPGTSWAGAFAARLADRHGAALAIDKAGPASTVARDAEDRDATVLAPTAREVATTAADLIDRIRDTPPRIRFRAHPAFTAALDAVTTERLGDGVKLSRRHSSASIAVLEAASLALHALRIPETVPVPPMIWSPS